jgi:hypothetical protein
MLSSILLASIAAQRPPLRNRTSSKVNPNLCTLAGAGLRFSLPPRVLSGGRPQPRVEPPCFNPFHLDEANSFPDVRCDIYDLVQF